MLGHLLSILFMWCLLFSLVMALRKSGLSEISFKNSWGKKHKSRGQSTGAAEVKGIPEVHSVQIAKKPD